MEFRTRHMALLSYTGISVLIIAKDLITDPVQLIALIAPIGAMFAWDKLKATKPA